MPCDCIPYENICCCQPIAGITVTQPVCQRLPSLTNEPNPVYLPGPVSKSYFTYKIITDCANSTNPVEYFVIPICENIIELHLIVYEKVDTCGDFTPIAYSLSPTDPTFGNAPEGYQFLRVDIDGRYEKGLSATYLLEISGEYPIGTQPIGVRAATNTFIFSCEDCYLVPMCPAIGELFLSKTGGKTITDNEIVLNYSVEVANTGSAPLTDVQFTDTIIYGSNIIIGDITVNPTTLEVDTSIPGRIVISGNLGTITPNQPVFLNYEVTIQEVLVPGTYIIENLAVATSEGQTQTAVAETSFSSVRLQATKCCSLTENNQVRFGILLTNLENSPATTLDILDTLTIPANLVVVFQSFDGCNATFENGASVPLLTEITGPQIINIRCNNVSVPQGGLSIKNIVLNVVETSAIGVTETLTNTLRSVTLVNQPNQILLGVANLPALANVNVVTTLNCDAPCPLL